LGFQDFINLAAGTALAALGWFARQLWDAVKELRRDLHALEVQLPVVYVTKSDHESTMNKIEHMFQRIFDKLDEKADKR
jgi:hypothetical protein